VEKIVTIEELKSFELEIFNLFKNGKIKSPIHLRGGNEEYLRELFKERINESDSCFCSWASHLECLLKGVPREKLKKAILNNKSISLSFREFGIMSSGIVGGIIPIAVGTAMAIKRRKEDRRVWCFVGDMTYFTGIVQESIRYSLVHDLPITFVIADNGLSVETPTSQVWGEGIEESVNKFGNCLYYSYTNTYPHAGVGEKVMF
jgi:TPP-dependent pyruvate/acetoin dehydrogenase alpha subunit